MDYNWLAVKQYIQNEKKIQETEDDKFHFNSYEPKELEKNTYTTYDTGLYEEK